MTHKAPASRTVSVEALSRVEGEGAMYVETVDGEVIDVQLRIYEPPRFFEAFLRGRGYLEPPDITARICGICPVAYQIERVPGHRGRMRRDPRRTARRVAPAHLLRRVDRESHAARVPVARPRLRRSRRARCSWRNGIGRASSVVCG